MALGEVYNFAALSCVLLMASHLAAMGLCLVSHVSLDPPHLTRPLSEDEEQSWYRHDPVIASQSGDLGVIYLRAFYWGFGVV